MLKDIIEKIEKIISENQNAYMHPALTRVEKVMTGKFLNTIEPLLPDLKKEAELQEEIIKALVMAVKENRIKDFETVSFFINIIEKYYNKKWEEIIK